MSAHRITALLSGVVFVCLGASSTIIAKEPLDCTPSIPVETVGSRLAYPTNIHARVTVQGVEVNGKLKRKRYTRRGLGGHVDVELLDPSGRILESELQSIPYRPGSVKHDRKRYFSAVLPVPKTNQYSVRIQHHIGMTVHKRMK